MRLSAAAIFLAALFSLLANYQALLGKRFEGRELGSRVTLEEKIYSLHHPGKWYFSSFLSKDYSTCAVAQPVCPNENITFWFYTRKTQQYPTELDFARPETLRNLSIVEGAPWKVVMHGYTESRMTYPTTNLINAYFRTGDYNIIALEFTNLVRDPCYYVATLNIPTIANCTAQILDELITNGVIPLEDLHIVGFSLGVHVAGLLYLYLNSGVIPRITGLDPCGLISYRQVEVSTYTANKGCARFFDAIHSDAGMIGLDRQSGDVDFWINGGSTQPECNKSLPVFLDACDHLANVRIYSEAIIAHQSGGKQFWAFPCNSLDDFKSGSCKPNETNQILMGPDVPLNARGNYFLMANSKQPYARGKYYSPP